jgi:hypothetical protein
MVNYKYINELRKKRPDDVEINELCDALDKAWTQLGATRDKLKNNFFCSVCVALVEQRAHLAIGNHGVTFIQILAWRQHISGAAPVRLWSDEAQGLIGVKTRKALSDNRDICVSEGWLDYVNKGPRIPSEYTVTIPDPEKISDFKDIY